MIFCSCDLDWSNDLDIQTWPRYSEDVYAYQKMKF